MNDITKLPKWAQQEIQRLERQLSATKQALEDKENNKESLIWTNDYTNVPVVKRYIQDDEVSCQTKNGSLNIAITPKENYIEIRHIVNSSMDALVIHPRFSNSIELLSVKR